MAKRDISIISLSAIILLLIIIGIILIVFNYNYLKPSNKCNYDSEIKKYIGKNKEECRAINFLCIQGMEPFIDECGCGCKNIENNNLTDSLNCTSYEIDKCPLECAVCPPCVACSSIKCSSKEFCKSQGFDENWYKKQNYCKPSEREADICIQLYQPVCGWFDSGKIKCIKYPCAKEFSNSCFACANENVLYWTDGTCPK